MKIKKTASLILAAVMLVTSFCLMSSAAWVNWGDIEPGDPGDSNGDGKINLLDVQMVMQYIAGWELAGEFIFDAADLNMDEKVNLIDVQKLLQHIAGWNDPKWDPTQKDPFAEPETAK